MIDISAVCQGCDKTIHITEKNWLSSVKYNYIQRDSRGRILITIINMSIKSFALSNTGDTHLITSESKVEELQHRQKILRHIKAISGYLCDDCTALMLSSLKCQVCESQETEGNNLYWYMDKKLCLTNILNGEYWLKSLKDLCLLKLPEISVLPELGERRTFLQKVMRSNGYLCETCVSQIM